MTPDTTSDITSYMTSDMTSAMISDMTSDMTSDITSDITSDNYCFTVEITRQYLTTRQYKSCLQLTKAVSLIITIGFFTNTTGSKGAPTLDPPKAYPSSIILLGSAVHLH